MQQNRRNLSQWLQNRKHQLLISIRPLTTNPRFRPATEFLLAVTHHMTARPHMEVPPTEVHQVEDPPMEVQQAEDPPMEVAIHMEAINIQVDRQEDITPTAAITITGEVRRMAEIRLTVETHTTEAEIVLTQVILTADPTHTRLALVDQAARAHSTAYLIH